MGARNDYWCHPQSGGHRTYYLGHKHITRAEYVEAVGAADCDPHIFHGKRTKAPTKPGQGADSKAQPKSRKTNQDFDFHESRRIKARGGRKPGISTGIKARRAPADPFLANASLDEAAGAAPHAVSIGRDRGGATDGNKLSDIQ